jgi:hypothetical protein
VPDVVTEAMAEHLAKGPSPTSGDLGFTTSTGRPVRRNQSAELFRPGGGARLRRHVPCASSPLRLSLLIAASSSVKAVQEALGHATATETLDTYRHLWPADNERTRNAIDAAHWRPHGAHERGVGDPG